MKSVKVYTTPTCVYCHALMDWLDDLGVEYEEINAEGLESISSVPVTEIDGVRVLGFDRPKIKRLLKN